MNINNSVADDLDVFEAQPPPDMEWDKSYLDWVLVPISLILFIGYHIFLISRIIKTPMATVIGLNHRSRKRWVESIMTERKDILAIQTLRNHIMCSSVLASTSIIVSSGIAAFVFRSNSETITALGDYVYGSKSESVHFAKLLSLLVTFLFSFFCYMQSMRYINHVCFIINTPGPKNDEKEMRRLILVAHRTLKRGQNFTTLGNRAYYLKFPLLLWFFGPIPMFIGSVLMWFLLLYLDSPASEPVFHFHKRDGLIPRVDTGNSVLDSEAEI